MFKVLLTILIFFPFLQSFAQDKLPLEISEQVTTLKQELKAASNDSLKIVITSDLGDLYFDYNSDSAIVYTLKSIELINTTNKKSHFLTQYKARNLYNLGDLYSYNGQDNNGITKLKESLQLFRQINDSIGEADCLGNIGSIYEMQGNIGLALDFLNKSLSLSKTINYKESIALNLNDIAFIYTAQGHIEKAIEQYILSSQISKEIEDYETLNSTLINIGATYYKDLKNTNKALEYYNKALNINLKTDNQNGLLYCYNSLGMINYETNNYVKAKKFLLKSLSINNNLDNKEGEIYTYNSIALIYHSEKKNDSALFFAKKALKLSQDYQFPKVIAHASGNLMKIYEAQGDFENALKMQRLNITMRDSINNRSTQISTAESYAKSKYKEQKAIDDKKKEKEVSKERELKEKQKVITYSIIFILILVTTFLFFIFNRLAIVRKQKHEIKNQKLATENARQKLEVKNKEINDSINYAEMIQNSVLPSYLIHNLFPNSFIYFNPKENVSGDFFWLEKNKNMRYFSVADCTGHGIPGAFISMIGTILLNEIYNSKNITQPNLVLDELNRLIKLTLTDKNGFTIKDGMDISFASLNLETNEVLFSGANNPLWVISKDQYKIINGERYTSSIQFNNYFFFEIKGDKKPVGEYQIEKPPFTLNKMSISKNDIIYLLSDGYADQFGGKQNKKIKVKNLKNFLLQNAHLSMNTQKSKLHENFINWKGDFEQIDDVTIMGVKV